MTYLSFDLGLAHTGVAISHEGELAQPLTTIHAQPSSLAQSILKLVDQYQPQVILLGCPPHGEITTLAHRLKDELRSLTPTPVVLTNEALSTRHSQKLLQEVGHSVLKRRQKDHAAAAAFILQSHLDSLVK